jgi:hypothetical protein
MAKAPPDALQGLSRFLGAGLGEGDIAEVLPETGGPLEVDDDGDLAARAVDHELDAADS